MSKDRVSCREDGSALARRAASYARVSTDEQAREGFSLPEQEHRNAQVIASNGWTHAGDYSDPGVSGTLKSRPALDRLLTAIAEGRIDVVVVTALDRLG